MKPHLLRETSILVPNLKEEFKPIRIYQQKHKTRTTHSGPSESPCGNVTNPVLASTVKPPFKQRLGLASRGPDFISQKVFIGCVAKVNLCTHMSTYSLYQS